jgi:ubiquinone/menaquinone biosynthesis C-methylase UbiE
MLTLIDGHVHVHRDTEVAVMLDSAWENFSRAASELGETGWRGVLLLTEMKQAAWFETSRAAGVRQVGAWTLAPHPHDELVLSARDDGRELLLVAGRQVVTAEGIEVLTLATRQKLDDGQPLQQTLTAAAAAQALIVLPWAAGKWLGARGAAVAAAMRRQEPPLSVGDNGGRPAIWPAPAVFRESRARGRPLISGTDPLPLSGEASRVGSYGFGLRHALPEHAPGQALRERLRTVGNDEVQPFGRMLGASRFLRNQIRLRVSKPPAPATAPALAAAGAIGRETPDIETSSASYASRFTGKAGRYLLEVQSRTIAQALRDLPPGKALDVGGGHGQLVDLLRGLGWDVTVHGTDPQCEQNLRGLHGKKDCAYLQGDLFHLPVADRAFDLVIAVRLISHVEDWPRLVAEMCRVARAAVVIDYPSTSGLNALTPLLFGLKKSLEGNTRTYTSFSRRELDEQFGLHGFGNGRQVKQFFMPMVVHRMGKGAAPLRLMERVFRALGLTALAGSPIILRVDRV